VGSCADIVATAVKPLLQIGAHGFAVKSFSVFSDLKLASRWLSGMPLPFSGPVTYLFGEQLEEAGILVLNKADLLSNAEAAAVLELARRRFPEKPVRLQSTLVEEDVSAWMDALNREGSPPSTSIHIDYDLYGQAETELAWYDARVKLSFPVGTGRRPLRAFLSSLQEKLAARDAPVGHVKVLVIHGDSRTKISVRPGNNGFLDAVPEIEGGSAELIVNARVQTDVEDLSSIARHSRRSVCRERSSRFPRRNRSTPPCPVPSTGSTSAGARPSLG
jgi:hypothetical protein